MSISSSVRIFHAGGTLAKYTHRRQASISIGRDLLVRETSSFETARNPTAPACRSLNMMRNGCALHKLTEQGNIGRCLPVTVRTMTREPRFADLEKFVFIARKDTPSVCGLCPPIFRWLYDRSFESGRDRRAHGADCPMWGTKPESRVCRP